jgi:hypothetical protein
MADLDFSHNVQQIPEGQQLPAAYQRHEKIQPSSGPDYQSAVENYGSSTNWMSAVGSKVATAASNALSIQLGNQAGKNPSGDVFQITDADKVFAESYNAQAHSTLGLQANKLITDANIQMAKSPRLSPGLIASTNKQISVGLQNIFANAPTEIKPALESQYGNSQASLAESATLKMIGEQREDMRSNNTYASQVGAENSHSLMMAGKTDAAQNAFDAVVRSNNALVASHIITPASAKLNIDAARQSMLSGKYSKQYEDAHAQHKEVEFLRGLADKKPSDLSDTDYQPVVQNVMQHAQMLNNLRSQDEQLRLTKFREDLLTKPGDITGAELQDLKENLSESNFETAQLDYFKKLSAVSSKDVQANSIINNLNNHELYGQSSTDAKNEAFDKQVQVTVKNNKYPELAPVTPDQAEAQVAASFPGPVPKFINGLNAKANSSNPTDLESVGRQINYMYESEKGGNLEGLSPKSRAMVNAYESLRRSHDPVEAGKLAYDSIQNISNEDLSVINEKWTNKEKQIKQVSGGELNYYSKLTDIDTSNLTDPIGFVQQARSLMQSYFVITHGDEESAKKMLAQDIKQHYGVTNVNGKKETSLFPIENFVNTPTNPDDNKSFMQFPKLNEKAFSNATTKPYAATGTIQDDIIEQVSNQLAPIKEQFDKGQSPFYWEIEARPSLQKAQEMQSKRNKPLQMQNAHNNDFMRDYTNGSPIVIHKIWKNGVRETNNLIVKANPWLVNLSTPGQSFSGAWDVVLATDNGYKPLNAQNPHSTNVVHYKPNIPKIRSITAKINRDYYGR